MKKLVVGNWKMNPQRAEDAKSIAQKVKRNSRNIRKTQIVLCPPFVYIPAIASSAGGNIFLGAQDVFYEQSGNFTGEISAEQLARLKTNFVIVGHSERRQMGESDEVVGKKIREVLEFGMSPILCVGEKERDPNGDYYNFIKHQIQTGLKEASKKFIVNLVVAYEPVWAIGAKEAMKASELHEMSIFIRKVLKDLFGDLSLGIRILYGGSVDRVNAENLVKEGNVSGLLIGRVSLNATDFIEITRLIDQI